jgi:hypothetical protein
VNDSFIILVQFYLIESGVTNVCVIPKTLNKLMILYLTGLINNELYFLTAGWQDRFAAGPGTTEVQWSFGGHKNLPSGISKPDSVSGIPSTI